MGIAYETLLTLQLLESRGNGGHHTTAETIAMQSSKLTPVARPRIKTVGLVRLIWFKGAKKNEEWVDIYYFA